MLTRCSEYRSSKGDSPIWLYVRSLTTHPESESPQAQTLDYFSYSSDVSKNNTKRTLAPTSSQATVEQRMTSSDRDHEDSQAKHRESARPGNFEGPELHTDLMDLVQCTNICERLQSSGCGSNSEENCLGYLMSTKTFQHFLYATSRERRHTASSARGFPVTLQEFLQRATDESLDIVEQLQLAHKLAVALLQYHSTPWLQEQWGLRDISLFQQSAVDTDMPFRTLHFSACFPRQKPVEEYLNIFDSLALESSHSLEADPKVPQGATDVGNSIETLQAHDLLLYGIGNMTLSSLGIALLEIGHRKPLKMMGKANELYTARRVATFGTPPLRDPYQDIVQKCLRCDFGAGHDLSSTKLQSVVFSEVVCELQRLIEQH